MRIARGTRPESFVANVDRRARFQREAEFPASLNQLNIAQNFGLEHTDGNAMLVLEQIEGQPLAKSIKQETPTRITASHLVDGKVDKTRPLCPYGQTAHYDGEGDSSDAANFSCKPWNE